MPNRAPRTRPAARTPTEVLIAAMENVEEMDQIMVIFRLKPDAQGHDGMGWTTELKSLPEKLAFMEEAKISMYHAEYGSGTR